MMVQWKIACWLVMIAFFIWIISLALVGGVGADDTYYNTYSFTCSAGGDCEWVMTDIEPEPEPEECPTLWNTYDQDSGLLIMRNVRLKIGTAIYELKMVIFQDDEETGAFIPIMSE